jgi:hypothetical protein
MFDPEGNVFVPGVAEVKRRVRKDGKMFRPTPQLTELWIPRWEERGVQFPWSEEEGKDENGDPIPEHLLWLKYGYEHEWTEEKEYVVTRPPLVEIFKDRMSVEAVLFIHRSVVCFGRRAKVGRPQLVSSFSYNPPPPFTSFQSDPRLDERSSL